MDRTVYISVVRILYLRLAINYKMYFFFKSWALTAFMWGKLYNVLLCASYAIHPAFILHPIWFTPVYFNSSCEFIQLFYMRSYFIGLAPVGCFICIYLSLFFVGKCNFLFKLFLLTPTFIGTHLGRKTRDRSITFTRYKGLWLSVRVIKKNLKFSLD
jgi:hypothetical protein